MEAIKWSAEFLERRMAEHKRWQHQVEARLMEAIIDEVQSLPARAPKQSGRLFEEMPEPKLRLVEGGLQ